MEDLVIKTFAVFGVGAVITTVVFLGCCISECLREYSHRKKIEYIKKHRFDKPPLAKCYCIDCKSWNKYTQECSAHSGWRTADNWFCWDAEPRTNFDSYSEEAEKTT